MMSKAREAWQRLYSKHGTQYGGSGNIRPLEDVLKPDMLVLDAGCGDGKTTELLAKRSEVVGCDFSREALVSLRAHRDRDGSVNLVECNIAKLPFESEKFDAIACVHSLSHVLAPDRQRTADELARVLKVGGHMLVEVFGRNDLRYGKGEEVEDATFLRGNGIQTHYFSEGEISSLFPALKVISEISEVRRVLMGTVAGKRELVRALIRKV